MSLHASFEQADDVPIIWVLCEAETSAIVHELLEFVRLVSTELFDGHLLFLHLNVGVLFLLWSTWEALPRQWTSEEIEKDMTYGLEIVSSRLFIANVGVDTGISRSTGEVLPVSKRNVLSIGGLVTLSETKIDYIDSIFSLLVGAN